MGMEHWQMLHHAGNELLNRLHIVNATSRMLHDDLSSLHGRHRSSDGSDTIESAAGDVLTIRESGEPARAKHWSSNCCADDLSLGVCVPYNPARTMQCVIDDMLEYAQFRQGKLSFAPAPVDVASIVCSELKSHKSIGNLPLVCEIGPTVPRSCWLDEFCLRRVVQKGIAYACKSASDGSVTVRLSATSRSAAPVHRREPCNKRMHTSGCPTTREFSARLSSRRRRTASNEAARDMSKSLPRMSHDEAGTDTEAASHLLVEVIGPGPGLRSMDSAAQSHPFEHGGSAPKAHRNSSALTERVPGLNLHLAVAYQLVLLMGGESGLDDSPDGKGTRFWFTLPLASAVQPRGSSSKRNGPQARHSGPATRTRLSSTATADTPPRSHQSIVFIAGGYGSVQIGSSWATTEV